ncbi:MAG: type II toxin-antitoxin system prevent-host-death family antitoxin [Actinobacteria bacterium]|nr:type II toxin-antitoxin system prevent-host-death family antitoxin [Actinomycetota bacterium]
MSDVGVRELKKRLSEFLDMAANGEPIIVTDRGRPKALLGPLPGQARISEGLSEGWIARGSAAPLAPVKRWKAPTSTQDALDEDRGT